jgi:hypothetical protein
MIFGGFDTGAIIFANGSAHGRQSKLSPAQLDELQKATHFDKKELQQWYKGTTKHSPRATEKR